MGLRVINTVEKNVHSVPQLLVVVPANTPTLVLNSIRGDFEEYAGRYVQNVGANPCYYNFTEDAQPGSNNVGINNQQFNGILFGASAVDANGYGPGQQLDASNFPGQIWAFSVAGTTIACTVLTRKDLIKGGNPL